MKEIIILSERGWRGARTCALEAAKSGVKCRVYIKGRPSKEVREFVPKHPEIVNIFIPRVLFFAYFSVAIFIRQFISNIGIVVVERKRAYKIMSRFPFFISKILWIKELNDLPYFELSKGDQHKVELSSVLKSL
jgi:hypothetical protein